jgi:hypothetical protein
MGASIGRQMTASESFCKRRRSARLRIGEAISLNFFLDSEMAHSYTGIMQTRRKILGWLGVAAVAPAALKMPAAAAETWKPEPLDVLSTYMAPPAQLVAKCYSADGRFLGVSDASCAVASQGRAVITFSTYFTGIVSLIDVSNNGLDIFRYRGEHAVCCGQTMQLQIGVR